MAIYTSYYAGEMIGEPVSISLYPPKDWKGKHLPIFTPTPELLKWWKAKQFAIRNSQFAIVNQG